MGQMIKALRRGETIALMMDQAMSTGEKIPFMGRHVQHACFGCENGAETQCRVDPVFCLSK
jgi:lauroyl/myristoyl acyltransferase